MRWITRFLVIVCIALVAFWWTSPIVTAEEKYVPAELLVRFKPATSVAGINSINRQIGCEVIREIQFIEVHHLRITSGLTVEDAAERYSRSPNVEFAEPNYMGEAAQGVPDNPRVLNNAERWPAPPDWTFNPARAEYGWQWGLDNWGQTGGTVDADIDAPQMWRMITAADPDIIVAILDTGVDWDHADLAANIWTNPGEVPGDGIDNDDNNYIDDERGWDFPDNDNDPDDPNGHGTHVAGTVGAVGGNGIGVTGVCWSVQLMAVRILDAAGNGNTADLCLGIDYAMHGDAKIINMSLQNYPYTHSLEFAVDRANQQGILVVAAAGNSGQDIDVAGQESYPGNLPNPNVISVAASDHDDAKPGWSNWGAISVDLAAPGEDIYSTTPGDNYGYLSGTSMATPHVSGVAALCWTLDRIINPGITHLQVKDLLLTDPASFNAADKEKKPAFRLGGVGEVLTEGRLRAAQNADFGDAPDPPYPTFWPPLAWGALHLDCGREWLGYDVSLERDVLNLDGTDTDGIPNLVDLDGFDDAVTFHPPYFCKGPGVFDRVDVMVTVANPICGRYGGAYPAGQFLYLSSFFDFNNDGDWLDIFMCVAPGDAPEHLLIQAVGGPGAFSVVNPLPADEVVIDPSLWGAPPTQQSRLFELYFYSPPVVSDTIWSRFRVEYDDQIWPTPDNKFLGWEFDYSLFGEVEDYVLRERPCNLIQDYDTPTYYFDLFAEGDALKKYFDPEVYCEDPVYPYMIHDVEFYLYDFAGVQSVDVRIDVEMVSYDSCISPGPQIYLSDPLTVTTFYPEMVHLDLPVPVCVWEPFFISIEYASGVTGSTPSILLDAEVYPCDTCHAWVYYVSGGYPFWIEWSDFWSPPTPGCPIIRVTGFADQPDCVQLDDMCGDCNKDKTINLADVVCKINYLFKGFPPPEPACIGDDNCEGTVDVGDVIYLVNYLYKGGPPPCQECCYGRSKMEEIRGETTERTLPEMRAVPRKLPQAPGDLKPSK